MYDPTTEEFRAKTYNQIYSCFYPNKQRFFDKFYERNCDTYALELFKQTYHNDNNLNELKQCCIDLYKVNFDNYYDNIPKLDKEKQISLSFQYKRTNSVVKLADKIFK
jgi:hypothetical protein